MTLPDDDLVPVAPEDFVDLASDPTLPLVTLHNVLNRPPSQRKRRVYIGSILLVCLIFLLLLWQAFLTLPRTVAAIKATTPPPLPPTPTLVAGGTISATIPIGAVHEHTGIAASATAVWVHDGPTGTVTRIDPRTNTVVATIAVRPDSGGGAIATDEQAVWVTDGDAGIVSRIDPQSNQVTATIQLTPGAGLLGVSPGTVWVINVPNNTLTKIDEQTNQVVATLSTPSLPIGVSYGAGSIWLCSRQGGTAGVTRLNPLTNQVQAQIDVGVAHQLECNGIAASAQAVWVPIFDELSPERQHLLERIDPTTNQVTDVIELGADMNPEIAADEHGVWVCDPTTGLLRVDPQRRRVVAQLKLPGGDTPDLGAGSLWLTRTSDNTVVRITPAP